MFLLKLVAREVKIPFWRLCFYAALAGISNALIIAMINLGASTVSTGSVDIWAASVFVLSLLTYIWSQRYLLVTTTKEVEVAIHRLRLHLMDDVRRSELMSLEAIGRADIFSTVTKETATLTQAATVITVAAQAMVLIVFTAAYIAYLSFVAFAMSTVVVVLSAGMFLLRSRLMREETLGTLMWENRLFERLGDMLDGFKEVRLNHNRSDDLFEDMSGVSTSATDSKVRSQTNGLNQFVFSQSAFYILLGTVVFVVPGFSQIFGSSIGNITTALLFITGSISSVVQSIPVLSNANVAAEAIVHLEERLRSAATEASNPAAEPLQRFTRIEMRNMRFDYIDRQSEVAFQIGPLDFELNAGDIVFVTGGNGSGKSTFLKVLTGLYLPTAGHIAVDGMRVGSANRDGYRGLFTAVYSDYHLFKRLYGIRAENPGEVDRLLAKFELSGKTGFVKGEFTTLDLSAGQRKRLALVVGLLEKRPVLVLDEWTADQDPEFRRKYYDELVPEFQRAGTTLMAVTHDDRLLSEIKIPIRHLRMDEGRFVSEAGGE